MQALLVDAQAGRFDVVYAEALDRVSSDQEDVAAIYKRLAHAGVQLITFAEGEVSELHIGLMGTMNALFLKDLAQKTNRVQRGRVEAGEVAGGNASGYRVVHKLLEGGTPVTSERELEPEQRPSFSASSKNTLPGLHPAALWPLSMPREFPARVEVHGTHRLSTAVANGATAS